MDIKHNKKRLHLGVMFGKLDDTSQYILWNGVVEYAKRHDIHLTAYFGAYQAKYHDLASHYETCFESVRNSISLDGLIAFSGYITTDMKTDVLIEQLGRLPKELPIVSVASVLPGIPSVVIDNMSGMHTITEHLIKDHDKRKLAFIKGPDGHYEAEERLKGYKAALKDNGIAFEERYVLHGNFLEESGRDAVIELLDKRKLNFDAIIASNDGMASAAMAELMARGINVHKDVAVTGFDDDVIALRASPTLSTMSQDFFGLGMTGAAMLCDIIAGKPVEAVCSMPPVFAPRESCGCFEENLLKSDNEQFDIAGTEAADSLTSLALLRIVPLLEGDVPEETVRQWVTELTAIIKGNPFSRGKLLHRLFNIINEYKQYSKDVHVWCDVLLALRESVFRFGSEVTDFGSRMSALFFAMMLVQDIRYSYRQAQDFDANDFRSSISKVTSSLILSFDIDILADEMHKLLPDIYMTTVLVCLYKNPINSDDPVADRRLETVLGYDGQKKFVIKHSAHGKEPPHDYSSISGFDFDKERRTLFFLPLFFLEKELGIAILPFDARVPYDAYDTLRVDISTAVKGAELVSQIDALSVIDDLTKLFNRRGFFRNARLNLQHLKREEEPVIPIILFIDMDNLKGINDTYGHKEGDAAIAAFANILKDVVRRVDVIGRMGGDEFVVFSSVKAMENVEQLKERIGDKLSEYNAKGLHPFDLGCSIGSAVLDALTMESLEAAINTADDLLYKEKAKKKR